MEKMLEQLLVLGIAWLLICLNWLKVVIKNTIGFLSISFSNMDAQNACNREEK